MALGTIYVELDLKYDKFEKSQHNLLKQSEKAAETIEGNFRRIGVTSDTIFQAMANKSVLAFEAITKASNTSLAERERAYSAHIAKINQLNQDMTKNPLFETMGIRSTAAIKAQMAAVESSYLAIKNSASRSAQDLINIERAKNAKLKELNAEMVGHHEWSAAAATRAILRIYAAYYVLSQAAQTLILPFTKGFKAVEDYAQSVASLAAMVVTFSEAKPGQTLADQWNSALKYSTAIVPVLEQIAAKTLLSGQETTALANAFARSGVFLRANNAAQIEGFTRISNALPLMTKGQEIMRQINTEIRSVMTGQNEQSSMMLQTLKALPGFSKENLELWRQQGTVLENIGKLLEGFGPATAMLENQWQAVKTTLDTTVTQILRAGMLGTYGEIITSAKELNKYLEQNKESFIEGITVWLGNFMLGLFTVKAEVLRLAMLLDKLGGSMTAAKMLLYGPGAALGVESSKKRFEEAAQQNIEFEKRYKESDAELVKLAERYNKLEQSISAAGLAASKLARSAAGGNEEFKSKPDTKIDKEILSAREQLQEEIRKNQIKIDQVDIDSYENALVRIKSEYEKRVKETQDVVSAKKWALQEVELAARKHDDEQSKRELKLAEERIKAGDRRTLSEWKADEELTKNQEKSLEDYNKMVAYNAEEALTDHDRAMNRINGRAAAMQKIIDKEREIGKTSEDVLRAQEKINAAIIAQWKAEENIKKLKGEADFYSNIRGFEVEAFDRRMKQIDAEYTANEKLYNAKIALEMKTQSIIAARSKQWDDENKNIKDIMASTEDMFGSAAEMFDKESSQYKTLMQIKQVMHTAELAMNVAKQVSNYQTLISAIAKAKAEGGAAVAAQGQIPVVGFAMAAAMAAMLSSLFATLGFSFGSGGSASAPSAAYGRGTTTLGGANDSGSESIGNSFKLMEDTYDLQKVTLTGIYDNMKQLNANITGIVKAVVSGNIGNMTGGEIGNTYAKIFSSIPYIGGVLDSIIGWALGGSKTTQTGSGIMVGGGAVNPYSQTHRESKGFFGIGGSSSNSTTIGAIDATLTNLFYGEHGVYTTLKDSVSEMATMLGGDVAKAEAKVFESFVLNFIGKTPEEISKIVAAKISEIGDNFAREVFGGLIDTYQQVGEGAFETAVRLANDLQSVTGILKMTGRDISSVTIDLSENLIEIAGGLDKLQEAANNYYDKFFSDAEKQADRTEMLTATLAKFNLEIPDTRDAFRDLVKAAGPEAYVALMKSAGAMDEFFTYLEDAAKQAADKAQELYDKAYADLESATRAVEQAQADLNAAYERDIAAQQKIIAGENEKIKVAEDLAKASQEAVDNQQKLVDSLLDIKKTIKDWITEMTLSDLSPVSSRSAWTSEYAAKKLAARSGSAEDISAFTTFAKEYLGFEKSFGTGGSYQHQYDMVMEDVNGLKAITDTNLTLAEQQLAADKAATDAQNSAALQQKNASLAAIAAASAQIASSQAQITAAQAMQMSIGQALTNLADAIKVQADAKKVVEDTKKIINTPVVPTINNASVGTWYADNFGRMLKYMGTGQAWKFQSPYEDVEMDIAWDSQATKDIQSRYPGVVFGSGGYSDRPSIFGEKGGEWAVPTYEPQRSSFLKKAPKAFWNNLGSDGGSNGESTIHNHNHIYIDSKEIQYVVAKGMKSNPDLIASTRRAVN
jgi:hypothetical protein